jgi:hypothetical protein
MTIEETMAFDAIVYARRNSRRTLRRRRNKHRRSNNRTSRNRERCMER